MKKEAEHKHLAPKKKRAGNTAKKVTLICVVVFALLMAGAAGFGIYVSGSDTIYPKVSLNGTDLGGMTVSEAADALTAAGWSEGDKTITVELPLEHTLSVTAEQVGAEVSAAEAAQKAFDYCHGGSIIENVMA